MASPINIFTINSLTLADLFNKGSEPEEYWTGVGKRDGGEEYLAVILLSPTRGFAVDVPVDIEFGMSRVELKASTPVLLVTYFSPEMYQDLLKIRILIDLQMAGHPLSPGRAMELFPLKENND